MVEVKIKEACVISAAHEGMDEFMKCFTDAIYSAIGGELNADNMAQLSTAQISLLAYQILRDEVMDGGFVQLIHNGYGGFIFLNPLSKVFREWGLADLHKVLNKCHRLYSKYHEEIERDCSDEEFMAMFEKYEEFDAFDDCFVENEEDWTSAVAHYIDEHISDFAIIEK
jgi:hypothetical protein